MPYNHTTLATGFSTLLINNYNKRFKIKPKDQRVSNTLVLKMYGQHLHHK